MAQSESDTAPLFETAATTAIVIDQGSGSVLLDKNADLPVPPASLAKLMTAEIVFDALKSGVVAPDTLFRVSEDAWRRGGAVSGGSTMFAEVTSEIAVSDLLRGMIVQSGNDAAIVLAEGLAGSEENFARQMNERAGVLGLSNTEFGNATGLPDERNRTTMRDMITLARHIYETYPDLFSLYGETEFNWNNILQRNRNPLVRSGAGDGMKTGFTEESGYAIVGTGERNGRRVFLAAGGMESDAIRADEARKLLDWALGAFDERRLFSADEPIGDVSVYGGVATRVDVVSRQDVRVLVPLGNSDQVAASIRYTSPLTAPVEAGQEIGTLDVSIAGTVTLSVPVFAIASVDAGAIHRRALDALGAWVEGHIQ